MNLLAVHMIADCRKRRVASVAHSVFRWPRYGLALALLVASTQAGNSQTPQYTFEHLTVEDGLSHNAVSSIVQDRQGFLWFGTQDGLNRYDGVKFTIYRNNPRDSSSLSNSNIRNLFADREGNVWVSWFGQGLNRFDPSTGTFHRYRHDPANDHSLSSNAIECIYQDQQGAIWLGTDAGLSRLDPATGRSTHYTLPETSRPLDGELAIQALQDDSQGHLWIAQGTGVAVLDYASGTIRQLYRGETLARWITSDKSGSIWVGTRRQILRYDPTRSAFQLFEQPQEIVYNIFNSTQMDGNGILWSNTQQGLFRYDPRTNTSRLFLLDSTGAELKHYPIRSVCVDRSGIVWIGTINGIYKFFPAVKNFSLHRFLVTREGRIDRNNVRSFAEDRTGAIWIATLDGLFRFDPRTKQSVHYTRRQPALSTVTASAFWSILSVSTSRDVTILADVNKLVFPSEGDITKPVVSRISPLLDSLKAQSGYTVEAMLQDRLGFIWIGFRSKGMMQYDPRRGTVRYFLPNPANPKRLNAGAVFALCETSDGSLWAATNGGGLHKFDRRTEEFTRYLSDPKDANSIGDNGVLSLLPDEGGILWVGTYAGLDRLDTQTGTFRHFTVEDGLANNVTYGILKDNHGNLWLSSNFGITRFNPETRMVKNYDPDDGVQDYEFNHNACFKASTGEMYFGGINGFNVFHPDSVSDNPHLPNLALVDLKILNKSVEPGPGETRMLRAAPMTQKLFLSYEDAVLTFEFAALEYTDPSLNQYAYMLEGFDHEWQYVGTKREATYTNLDPGTYTLRAKASNNDGVWNEAGTAIDIHIAPPWWMTWWFRSIAVLVLLSVGPIIYYRRVTALKRQHALQQEFSRQLIQSQEQERWRIASELHDGLGQDLIVVKNRAFLGLKTPAKATENLERILETITIAINDMREIARNLRPYQLDTFGLSEALRTTLKRVGEASSINFSVEVDDVGGLFSKEAETNIFRVVQESANNIVKHSGATEAWFIVRRLPEKVTIEIRDNGKGFDIEQVTKSGKRGLGLSGIGERVRIIGGTYHVASQPGKGTSSDMSIPIHQNSQRQ